LQGKKSPDRRSFGFLRAKRDKLLGSAPKSLLMGFITFGLFQELKFWNGLSFYNESPFIAVVRNFRLNKVPLFFIALLPVLTV
jgi:hypothetical protein